MAVPYPHYEQEPGQKEDNRGNRSAFLSTGLMFIVEPGIYIPNLRDERAEVNVAVMKDGVDVLTAYSREIRPLRPGTAS